MGRHNLTIDDLERWTASGAQWRVVDVSPTRAVVDLCACTGEAMERARSEDPAVIDYLTRQRADRDRS